MKKWKVLIGLGLMLVVSACSNKEYDQAMKSGYQLLREERYEEANSQFRQASLEEETEEAREGRSVAKDMIKANRLFSQGQWENIVHLKKEMQENPAGEAYNIVLIRLEDLVKRSEAVQEEQAHLTSLLMQADTSLEQEKFNEAIEAYQLIVESKTDHELIQKIVGQASAKQDKAKQEKQAFLEEQKQIEEEKQRLEEEREREEKRKREEEQQQEQGVSPGQAENIVRQALSVPSETIVEYDHDDGPDYIIHVYDIVEDEYGGHTATWGWYGVNKQTGEWYDWMAAFQ